LVVAAVGALVYACGSSGDESGFGNQGNPPGDDGGTSSGNPPGFIPQGGDSGPPPPSCVPTTCAAANANCGPIGDGCGGIINCDPPGGCPAGETCGGGGTPSQCGKPACKPATCTDVGATCGAIPDGCGGAVASCGTCDTANGQICSGSPASCITGGGGDGGTGDGGTCVAKTCGDLGINCGPANDGCGGFIASCGTCDATKGETCGGGGVPSTCGKSCIPKTTCPAGQNCGVVADGCGGVVSCGGACPTGQSCGGGGSPNVCGTSTTCTGLCLQQQTCPGGGTTSISGTVTTPNGVLPIYGALVYVPNSPVPAFTTGVSCDQCGAAATALVQTTTGPDGKFLLANVPVSSTAAGKVNNIPVVIQLGRWRKQFTIVTTACGNTLVPAASSALPHNKSEGDIPLTAISTGQVDGLECVFRKIGIDDAEFTNPSGTGRIRMYQDNGAVISMPTGACSITTTTSCTNFGGACQSTCTSNGKNCTGIGTSCDKGKGTCKDNGTCNLTSGTPPASTLYNDPAELAKYDMTIFECVGGEDPKPYQARNNVLNYANAGGRVYSTHFSYVWLYNKFSNTVPSPAPWGAGNFPWSATANWGTNGNGSVNQNSWASVTATIDFSFAKGQAFAQWLNIVGGLQAPLPSPAPPWAPAPKITINEARHDVDDPVVSPANRWLYTTTADTPNVASVQHYTFNTDFSKPAAQQCGRVLYSDFHVTTQSNTTDVIFPGECNTNPLTTQEKVLAFMLFDLASCVNTTPPSTSCTPLSCTDQGIECGKAGDGCGNVIDCPPCPTGKTCGGGGIPSKCGAPSCTPKTCAAGQCGKIADGCGGSVTCPDCTGGTFCGGGGANVCGSATCTAGVCPTPAAGSACGPVADGCGGLLSCACPAGVPCVNGKCGAPACTPRTCAQAGANCGQVADGCGGLLDCGVCLAPQTCGGGGTPNVCGGGVN
jgi:hypothetical protein